MLMVNVLFGNYTEKNNTQINYLNLEVSLLILIKYIAIDNCTET